jgi:hypothetical protein
MSYIDRPNKARLRITRFTTSNRYKRGIDCMHTRMPSFERKRKRPAYANSVDSSTNGKYIQPSLRANVTYLLLLFVPLRLGLSSLCWRGTPISSSCGLRPEYACCGARTSSERSSKVLRRSSCSSSKSTYTDAGRGRRSRGNCESRAF